ncbi:MAG: peptidyl-prolyl cis-trans isomerase [Verrucomicrobiota bacterium]
MRKHHKVLMILITALVCISFSWYWNRTDFSEMGRDQVGKIYDRNVSRVEFQRNARLLRLSGELGMTTLIQGLTAGARTDTEAFENFTWNLLVLRHEANRLGVRATAPEIAEVVKTLPPFRGENGFDVNKYTNFADHELAPMGFSESEIEELAADQLSMERLKQLLGAGVQVSDAETESDYEQAYGKMNVSVIRFRADELAKEVKISDDDVAKYYETHKAQLKSEEKRKIKFAAFALTQDQKKLEGKERIDALQKLADKANDFSQALSEKGADFDALTTKFQLPPHETGEFAEAVPDPQIKTDPQLARTAFQLTKENPNSDPIQTPDGFYVLHLTDVIPARPLTLEEARPKVAERLQREWLEEMVSTKAGDAVRQIREALKSGRPVEAAVQENGLKAEKLPPFSFAEETSLTPGTKENPPQTEAPDLPHVKETLSEMSPGEVSNFVQTSDGGLIVIFEQREPIDPTKFAQTKSLIASRYLRNKREIVFHEWLRTRRRAASIEAPRA